VAVQFKIAFAVGLIAAGDGTFAQDIVEFGADNRLIGEVRGLERGKLSFNTGSTGTIAIEWEDVTRIVSAESFG
jgi:hypothetical protein